ncbi:MAG: DUF1820 family protein [Thermoanaerobaculia bacterium]
MAERRVYKVLFQNQGELFEIYAKQVSQGNLYGFVEVEELLFGERSTVLVDPSEERLKTEFRDVKRIYIPMHSIVRIDEVAKEGVSRISPQEGGERKLASFPAPIYTPRGGSGES